MDPMPSALTWHQAAAQGNLPVVSSKLSAGQWIDEPDVKGRSALYLAAKKGHKDVVKALLENRAVKYENFNNNFKSRVVLHESVTVLDDIFQEAVTRFDKTRGYQEAVKYIQRTSDENLRAMIFANYALNLIFKSHDQAFELTNKIPEDLKCALKGTVETGPLRYVCRRLKSTVACYQVQYLSSIGAIEQAKRFAQLIHPRELAARQATLHFINSSQIGFDILNTTLTPNQFAMGVDEAYERRNVTLSEAVLKGFRETGSFARALAYTETINNPTERHNARVLIETIICATDFGLEATQEIMSIKVKKENDVFKAQFEPLMVEAENSGNYTAVIEFVKQMPEVPNKYEYFEKLASKMFDKAMKSFYEKRDDSTFDIVPLLIPIRDIYRLIPDDLGSQNKNEMNLDAKQEMINTYIDILEDDQIPGADLFRELLPKP